MVRDLKKHFPVRGGLLDGLLNGEKKFVHAVDGINFSIAKGTTLGIVGESGCGKSTTARLIAKLMESDSGSMIFDGDGVEIGPIEQIYGNAAHPYARAAVGRALNGSCESHAKAAARRRPAEPDQSASGLQLP